MIHITLKCDCGNVAEDIKLSDVSESILKVAKFAFDLTKQSDGLVKSEVLCLKCAEKRLIIDNT